MIVGPVVVMTTRAHNHLSTSRVTIAAVTLSMRWNEGDQRETKAKVRFHDRC